MITRGLTLATGLTCQQVAGQQELSMQTVNAPRRRWLEQGLAGLPDHAHSGAPAKLTAAETQRLLTWARAAPLTLTALKARHAAAGGTPVHVNTLTGVLKRAGFVWQRTRHRLKKSATTRNLLKHNRRLAPCGGKRRRAKSRWVIAMKRASPTSIPIAVPGPRSASNT